MANPFNAVKWPQLSVKAGFGALPGANTIVLGVGPGLGTGTLGGTSMVELRTDSLNRNAIRSIEIDGPGRESNIDTAAPATCAIVFTNRSGDLDPTNLSGPYVSGGESLVKLGAPLEVRAEKPAGMFWRLFTGRVADISLDAGWDPTVTLTCADGLEDLGRAELATEVAQFQGDYTGQRISNVADRAAWPTTARAIDRGNELLGYTRFGASALELMRQIELSEFGLLFVDTAGQLVFYDRYRIQTASRSVTVQAALTDTAGTSDLGMVNLVLSLSRERVFNSVAVTRRPHLDPVTGEDDPTDLPVEQVATDATSIADLGILSLGQAVGEVLDSDPACLAMAQGLVARYKDPVVRVREVIVNALRGDLWSVLLPLRVLDRISVRRDYGPVTIGPRELHIQKVAMSIRVSPATWEVRYSTSEPPPAVTPFVLGAGQLGVDELAWG